MSKQEKPYVIAVDFDGTLCTFEYPEIGEPNYTIIEALKHRQKSGCLLVLWSCREGDLLQEAVAWCASHGLVFDAVNENPKQAIEYYGTNPRKVGANEYWDDKAINPFNDEAKKLEIEEKQRSWESLWGEFWMWLFIKSMVVLDSILICVSFLGLSFNFRNGWEQTAFFLAIFLLVRGNVSAVEKLVELCSERGK